MQSSSISFAATVAVIWLAELSINIFRLFGLVCIVGIELGCCRF
jgi:hypothetical protein